MKDRQFETMAMTITAVEASAIIARKYPDLSEGFPVPEAMICTPPPPTRLRRKKPHSPYSKRTKLVDHITQIADRSLTILYPSIFSTEDCQEEDALLPYVSPLKAERRSSFLRVRPLSTPTKKSKRASRSLLDSGKRFRAHQTCYSAVGLQHMKSELASSPLSFSRSISTSARAQHSHRH